MSFGKKVYDDSKNKRTPEVRRRVLKKGRLILNNGQSTVDCLVRNVSAGGAKIQLKGIVEHQEFIVVIDDMLSYPCEVRWRRGLDCGVRFTGTQTVRTLGKAESALAQWQLTQLVVRAAPDETVRVLQAIHYLEDATLRAATADWAAAYDRILAIVRGYKPTDPDGDAADAMEEVTLETG